MVRKNIPVPLSETVPPVVPVTVTPVVPIPKQAPSAESGYHGQEFVKKPQKLISPALCAYFEDILTICLENLDEKRKKNADKAKNMIKIL
jgi:hypothetical protein